MKTDLQNSVYCSLFCPLRPKKKACSVVLGSLLSSEAAAWRHKEVLSLFPHQVFIKTNQTRSLSYSVTENLEGVGKLNSYRFTSDSSKAVTLETPSINAASPGRQFLKIQLYLAKHVILWKYTWPTINHDNFSEVMLQEYSCQIFNIYWRDIQIRHKL